jgi:AcrR family transcriptional regulator
MDQENDRRVRRSKRELAAALIQLTAERPYASIQVRDITDRADVGYATFYRHFESKDDLMLSVFAEITAELEESAGEAGEAREAYFRQEGSLLFTHVQKYEGLYRSILKSPEFVQQLKGLLIRRTEEHMLGEAVTPEQPAFPLELAANHIVTALIGMIEWWLDEGQPQPVEEMARIYERLIIQATWYALDNKNRLSFPRHPQPAG